MDTTASLLKLLDTNDVASALAMLDASPDAARGTGPKGESPLLAALYRGLHDVAARIASLREVDLHEAAAMGDVPRIGSLLDHGADIHTYSYDGWTPLHLGGFLGHAPAARLLLERGADCNALSQNYMTNTPLCAALAGAGNEDVVRRLLLHGADVNLPGATGVTPLHVAASRGALHLVQELLARGANAAARLDDGSTPADIAAARGHGEVAEYLRDRG